MNRLHLESQEEVVYGVQNQRPSRRALQRMGFVIGGIVGGYIGGELVDASQFLSLTGAFEYMIHHHSYLAQGASMALGAVIGDSFGRGLQSLIAPMK